ncbi:unnamed protein product [Staurois parvus]|uniref:Uncharacterized protein n=1 Tax=Staurois parvus TaxID=386267 RepID=A0ABN9GVD2_9NEOB|nr:unnamed protein product [Staurois parvus]
MGPLCPWPNSKKPMKKVPGASHGPPTDPRALGQCPSFQMVSPPLATPDKVGPGLGVSSQPCHTCWSLR